MKKYLPFAVPVGIVLVSSLLLFSSLDRKIQDRFHRALPPLKEDQSILLLNVDDLAIEQVGLFPWPRDIMADALVFLKEMGARTIVFDLSYLDRSPLKVDPAYIQEELPQYIEWQFSAVDEAVAQLMDAFSERKIDPSDADDWKGQMLDITAEARSGIETSVSYAARDVDEYLAKALGFFGNSWLTLTMYSADELGGPDKAFSMDAYNLPWLREHIALSNIYPENDSKTPEQLCFQSALPVLMQKARGAGFVNAYPDPDGYRRRVHLVMKHEGTYYGQLVFMPLLDMLGKPEIEVTNDRIVLKNARVGERTKTISIPRDEEGSVIVNWPRKQYADYHGISVWQLIKNTEKERALLTNLKSMEEYGFLGYWTEADTPTELYARCDYLKEELMEAGAGRDELSADDWLASRADFFSSVERLLSAEYETIILSDIDTADLETRDYVADFFAGMRTQFAELLAYREETRKVAKDAFCIIGTTATSTTDEGLNAYQERFPNVGIHATLANMILSEDFLDDAPWIASVLSALLLSLLMGYLIRRYDSKRSLLAGAGVIVLSCLVPFLVWRFARVYIGVIVPLVSTSGTFVILTGMNFFNTVREKSFLRSAFSRYLSPEVINEIINDPSRLNLGGEKREMTAIFTDIRGFSGISERMDPAELVNLLNLYLTEMSDIILANRGTIDKYEGDAIIAFFGAPIKMENHASLACKTAIQMKRAERLLNRRIRDENLSPEPLFTRIGINTGDMVVGNMGTANKMDYTIMGNAVNLAARLEGVNKQYDTRGVLISEHTRRQIGDEFLLRRLDSVRVVGVNTPIRLFELCDIAIQAADEAMEEVKNWEAAMDMFEGRRYQEASLLFERLAAADENDGCARLYSRRCAEFIARPPEESWDGVFNLTQK